MKEAQIIEVMKRAIRAEKAKIDCTSDDMASAALAALKASGLAIVPVEPTHDQDIAGLHSFNRTKATSSLDQVRKIYRAMIGKV